MVKFFGGGGGSLGESIKVQRERARCSNTLFFPPLLPLFRSDLHKSKKMALRWESHNNGNVPRDAVSGGWDANGNEPLFVGKQYIAREL